MNIDKLTTFVPDWYLKEQKKEIVLLLIDLANICLNTQRDL